MSNFLDRIREPFQDEEYRHTYANDFLDAYIATQLRFLRQQRNWTQAKLADLAGMKQTRISVLEDVNYSSWSISTLRRLAEAFDLRLRVSFEEFNTLVDDYAILDRKSLERREFSEDPLFNAVPSLQGAVADELSDISRNSGFKELKVLEKTQAQSTIYNLDNGGRRYASPGGFPG